jgi:hypothetical protein
MSAPTTARARPRSLAGLALRAFGELSATRFVVAVALGLTQQVFIAITYLNLRATMLVEAVALLGSMAAIVAADRAGYARRAWALLPSLYAILLLAGSNEPSVAREILIAQIMAHCLVLAVAVADQCVAAGSSGRLAYTSAALGGVTVGALMWTAALNFGPNLFTDDSWRSEMTSPWFVLIHPLFVALGWLLFGGAAVLLYGERRLALATLKRLRAAELERIVRSRQVIESRLQAMQARIEPQFLFDTLAHVRRLYGSDPALAGRMLEELAAFLRAAMPRMRDTSSTVAREVELVRAYLGIARIRMGNTLDFSIDVPADVAEATLPPMMLLPLVNHALAHGWRSAQNEDKLSIKSSVVDRSLQLAVVDAGTGFVADSKGSAIANVRERLAALYGEKASLKLCFMPSGATQALLMIPYERAA